MSYVSYTFCTFVRSVLGSATMNPLANFQSQKPIFAVRPLCWCPQDIFQEIRQIRGEPSSAPRQANGGLMETSTPAHNIFSKQSACCKVFKKSVPDNVRGNQVACCRGLGYLSCAVDRGRMRHCEDPCEELLQHHRERTEVRRPRTHPQEELRTRTCVGGTGCPLLWNTRVCKRSAGSHAQATGNNFQ